MYLRFFKGTLGQSFFKYLLDITMNFIKYVAFLTNDIYVPQTKAKTFQMRVQWIMHYKKHAKIVSRLKISVCIHLNVDIMWFDCK